MKNAAQEYLQELGHLPPDSFESRFSRTSMQLGLGDSFSRNELTLLYEATFRATLCNLAINGLGALRGNIRPDGEANRSLLERDFMVARDVFYASPGWQDLEEAEQEPINRIFLGVSVAEDKLAW
jgi:hypothetical protein